MIPNASQTGELNRRWAAIIVEFCIQNGIDQFFVAPGSRCTPLTVAIANHPDTQVIQHFDERGLAFACQGYGRATNRPAAFVCTSGTAVANAFPAVVEASMENVPMLLLTADRPPELHGIGANQTIAQGNLFGQFTRSFVNADCFAGDDAKGIEVLSQAILSNRTLGPIHINCMFREPFGTTDEPIDISELSFRNEKNETDRLAQLENIELPTGETIVILGRCMPHEANAARNLANRMKAPLFADISSGTRDLAYDLALNRNDIPEPKNVIHLGGRFVSKRLLQFLERCSLTHYWHVGNFGEQTIDPVRKVTRSVQIDLATFCQKAKLVSLESSDFLNKWKVVASDSLRLARKTFDSADELNEPLLASDIAELIPAESGLFLGNSMPIRDMDMFGFWTKDRPVFVGANRGASGIDGLLASSIGFAHGLQKPTTIVLGDLSALHDLNSLDLLRRSKHPMTVVVVNNDGGGIFHFLPVANETTHFESYFGTPHGLAFQHAAEQFQLPYTRCKSRSEFRQVYAECVGKRTSILEINTDRESNHRLHMSINRAIQAESL